LKEENKRLQSKVDKNDKTLHQLIEEQAEHEETLKVVSESH